MKKLLLFVLIYVIICFAIPIIFTKRYSAEGITGQTEEKQEQQVNEKNSFDYKQYNTIKLLHTQTGEIEELEL